jgi:Family of unknown function (DUF6476)
MRFLKVITIAMAVLIVVGTTVLLVVIARRLSGGTVATAPIAAVLDEPAGTRIAGIAATGDRLAVQLQGGGSDRVLLLDPRTGAVVGRVGLRAGER